MPDEKRSETFRMRLTPEKLAVWRAEAEAAGLTLTSFVEGATDDAIAVARTIRRNEERERRSAAGFHAMDPFEARRRDWGRTP